MRLRLSFKYAVSTALILIAVLGVIFVVISKRHEKLVIAQTEMQAKALFQQVVITRRWISDHGGVFVEKLPWVQPNPHLPHSTITDRQGRRYIKQNPALVTKHLSSYAEREGLYFFHISSLKLMNPENAPDEFETRALKAFEAKTEVEATTIEKIGNAAFFRYIAPLQVEAACLTCHSHQGYRIGDIRGAISVSVPIDSVLGAIRSDRTYILAGGFAAAVTLMLALFLMTRRMVIKPIAAMRSHMQRFSRDGNPSIPLLRTGDEIEDLSASFREMAKSIDEYHACLQEKIKAATGELTEKNETLLRLNRTKSDFIAKISHELRTPLTAIKGAMDYLSVKLSRLEGVGRDDLAFFALTKNNTERLIRLVNNLLDFERIELGSFEMRMQKTNLKTAFTDVIDGFRLLAEEKNVSLRLAADEAVAVADEDRIKQVLTNMLTNALHFAPPFSEIAVSLAGADNVVRATVEDAGEGVSESDRERIFEQFFTKGVKDGTGLGLAICRGIVEAHGGEIGVETGGAGGSRFWFTLPSEGAWG